MARNQPMIHVRMSPELKNKLRQSADKNNRSLNAEIVQAIEEYLKKQDHTN